MSDGGRERASLGVEVWKSSQKWSAKRSVVRSIAWLDLSGERLSQMFSLTYQTAQCPLIDVTNARIRMLTRVCDEPVLNVAAREGGHKQAFDRQSSPFRCARQL